MVDENFIEELYVKAWRNGSILRQELQILAQATTNPGTQDLQSRLLYAIRRGRLMVIDT